jgi:hypothetical protein
MSFLKSHEEIINSLRLGNFAYPMWAEEEWQKNNT